MTTDGGESLGRIYVGDLTDAQRFADRLIERGYGYEHPWWLVTIGSMSPKARKSIRERLTQHSGVSLQRFRLEDRKQLAQSNPPPPIAWKERLQLLAAFPIWIWFMVLTLVSLSARLIGRGPRTHLLHVRNALPPDGSKDEPPEDPPGGSHVREPRRPLPSDGSAMIHR